MAGSDRAWSACPSDLPKLPRLLLEAQWADGLLALALSGLAKRVAVIAGERSMLSSHCPHVARSPPGRAMRTAKDVGVRPSGTGGGAGAMTIVACAGRDNPPGRRPWSARSGDAQRA